MRFLLRTLPVVWVAVVLWPRSAAAGPIYSVDGTVFGDGMTYVPPADLTGWFFNPDGPPPFPLAPDPSQPWTSAENMATLNAWLGVGSDFGPDPATLEQLSGTGMTNPAQRGPALAQDAGVPEPSDWVFAVAGVLMMGTGAAVRRRRRQRRYL